MSEESDRYETVGDAMNLPSSLKGVSVEYSYEDEMTTVDRLRHFRQASIRAHANMDRGGEVADLFGWSWRSKYEMLLAEFDALLEEVEDGRDEIPESEAGIPSY